MLALISTSPFAIIKTVNADIMDVNIPDKWQAQRVTDGYQTPDGKYKLVTVVPFTVPGGQQTTGSPTYSINPGTGVVTESYATQAIPSPTFIPFQMFLSRMTATEYIAIKKAIASQIQANNATVALWYDKVSSRQGIDTADPQTATIKAAAVTAGLLTQARANIIFTP
jgi:hypothetical protein